MSIKTVVCYTAFVRLKTSLGLLPLGELLSLHLFGGIPFTTTYEYDEGEGLRLVQSVLGMTASIVGCNGEYVLTIDTCFDIKRFNPVGLNRDYRQIGDYVLQCLAGIDGVVAFAT